MSPKTKPLKICMISKAPPIQGGVSKNNYWLAHDLAELGHKVWVVSNAEDCEPEFRMSMNTDDRKRLSKRFKNGGMFKIVSTRTHPHLTFIPYTKPYVTQLSALATDIVQENNCDLIYASYFEPYGMAATLTSIWTGVPFVISHAGSDVGHLMLQSSLFTSYSNMLKSAKYVITNKSLIPYFNEIGIKRKNIFLELGPFNNRSGFTPDGSKLKINSYLPKTIKSNGWLDPIYKQLAKKKHDPSIPTIGIYGKIGDEKGTYDLLNAISILKKQKFKCQLIVLGSGWSGHIKKFTELTERLRIEDRVWLIPFAPHWRVPEFIRSVDAICYLERDFWIESHNPLLPKEILACGKCLILSGEIIGKFSKIHNYELKDKVNIVMAGDPKKHLNLAKIIKWTLSNTALAKRIGSEGAKLEYNKQESRKTYLKKLDQYIRQLAN